MRVSLKWLRELVPFESDPSALAEKLSLAGFEVDGDEDLSLRVKGVVVGRVESKYPHPDATRLSVCMVSIGPQPPLQIVCGASNVREGMVVAVATVGSHLPAIQLTIKPTKLRGVESCGMLCSLAELGLKNSVDGLVDLEQVALLAGCDLPQLGEPVAPLLGLDDRILELAITANRADGLSMRGLAREVAALEKVEVTLPPLGGPIQSTPLETDEIINHADLFSLTALTGIEVGDSPLWLRKRLEAAGQRSVNNVVDITNLVMLETGQPLHAYDRNSLPSQDPSGFGLRFALPNETLLCLDGVQRNLDENNLLVTQNNIPIALAGVIGADLGSVNLNTSSIFLEAAVFSAPEIRRSSRAVGIRSEASARFERGVARENCLVASDRAVELLQQLCGAEVSDRWVAQIDQPEPDMISLRRSAFERLLGPIDAGNGDFQELDSQEVTEIFERLGCEVIRSGEAQSEAEIWNVKVPPARLGDLRREVDLIEEIARLVGYDRFCLHLPDPVIPGGLNPKEQIQRRLCSALRAIGMQEISHLSLVPKSNDENPNQVSLANPLLADYGHLRTSLIDGLIAAASRNIQTPLPGFWGFEIGKVFIKSGLNYHENYRLVGIICGPRKSEVWSNNKQLASPDYFQSRGLLAQALNGIGLKLTDQKSLENKTFHPGRCADLKLKDKSIGKFGELHPQVADAHNLPAGTCLFDLELEPILEASTGVNQLNPIYKNYPTVPASERDLAFFVSLSTFASDVLEAIENEAGSLLENTQIIDRYQGSPVPQGYCSMAVRLRFRAEDSTLRDEQVDPLVKNISAMLVEKFNVELRV
jgi:phenylalanyl-tRNA synthetase beta chain